MSRRPTIEPGSDPNIERTRHHIRELLRQFWNHTEQTQPLQIDTDEWPPTGNTESVTNASTDSE